MPNGPTRAHNSFVRTTSTCLSGSDHVLDVIVNIDPFLQRARIARNAERCIS